jgi:hypothetical protein
MDTGVTAAEPEILADPRVPYPPITTDTECRTEPNRWHPAKYSNPVIEARQAIHACRRCPHARACLLWALANPELSKHGIWAATHPYQRRLLRDGLVERLGEDWVGVVTGRPAA